MISKKEFIDWFESHVTIDSLEVMEYWDYFKGEHKLGNLFGSKGLMIIKYLQQYPADELFTIERIKRNFTNLTTQQIMSGLQQLMVTGYVTRKFIESDVYYELTKRGQELDLDKGVV